MSTLELLERELSNAHAALVDFSFTRHEDDWRTFSAAYLRASLVAKNVDIDFQMPKPVFRVKASSRAA